MKTLSRPAVVTPGITVLILLAAAVTYIGIADARIPFLSNTRVNILLLVVIGTAICSRCGIGRIAATKQWSHPLSIVGYILGVLILLVTLGVFSNWELPFIQTGQQALIAITILICLKMVNSATHHLLVRG
jgi:hypothetical protein